MKKAQSLHHLLSVLVAAAAPFSAACGHAGGTPLPESATCPSFSGGAEYAPFTPAAGIDGVAIANVNERTATISPIGAPCKTAKDMTACNTKVKQRLADTATSTGWSVGGGQLGSTTYFGVVTRGDDVQTIATLADLQVAIAPIHTKEQALSMAYLAGHYPSCESGNVRTDADGFTVRAVDGGCGAPEYELTYKVSTDGTVAETSKTKIGDGDPNCVEGRRPAGLDAAPSAGWLVSVNEHLREVAFMETAAIWAFDELCADLERVGAPLSLQARAAQAREDEVAHACIMHVELHRRGQSPRTAVAPPARQLSLLELARLNATEGCVRETYGALLANHQGAYASDPALRRAFTRIARDEAEHAELSLDLGTWLDTQLSSEERAEVARAKQEAVVALFEECARLDASKEVREEAGMPTAQVAQMMLSGLCIALDLAA